MISIGNNETINMECTGRKIHDLVFLFLFFLLHFLFFDPIEPRACVVTCAEHAVSRHAHANDHTYFHQPRC